MNLAVLDRLSPGALSGVAKIATTGTIEADATVGPVGGVKQKTLAVKAAGAKLFLVPADEYDEARAHAGRMQVEPVRSLDEALTALRRAGGTPIAGTPVARTSSSP
jgi:PDZ domain-containing protein